MIQTLLVHVHCNRLAIVLAVHATNNEQVAQ